MPSKSKKQHNLMAMVANDPKAAKRMGISQKVGKEFMRADKGKKFDGGGEVSAKKLYDAATKLQKEDWSPVDAIKRALGGKNGEKPKGKAISITRETVTASPDAIPSEIKDKLQDTKNQKDFENWEKSRNLKKGGTIKARGMFGGKETKAEERAEAKAVKSGKITPQQYAKGEAREGHGAGALAKGKALKSGKVSVESYTSKGMARGGGCEVRGKTRGRFV